jgi:hypothetical protein
LRKTSLSIEASRFAIKTIPIQLWNDELHLSPVFVAGAVFDKNNPPLPESCEDIPKPVQETRTRRPPFQSREIGDAPLPPEKRLTEAREL